MRPNAPMPTSKTANKNIPCVIHVQPVQWLWDTNNMAATARANMRETRILMKCDGEKQVERKRIFNAFGHLSIDFAGLRELPRSTVQISLAADE